MGDKTKIDWAEASWNPVTGCLHGCEYCYARKIAERFGGFQSRENGKFTSPYGDEMLVLDEPVRKELIENVGYYDMEPGVVYCGVAPYPNFFYPTFHRYKLNEPQRWKKPRNIFVCSMADLFGEWVPDRWIKEVFDACEAAPQHRYLFLTKNPKRLCNMANAYRIRSYNIRHPDNPSKDTAKYQDVMQLPIHDNWWFGSSLDNAYALRFQGGYMWHSFTSIEPLTEYMDMGLGSFGSDEWTIIGAETGNRKNKVIPDKYWIENIVEAADITGVKIFMKESLRDLMGADFRQEYPWEVVYD